MAKKVLLLVAALLLFFGFRGTVSHSILVAFALLPAGYCFSTVKLKNALDFKSAVLLAGIPMTLFCLANGRNIASYDNYGTMLTTASLVRDQRAEISAWTGQQWKGKVDCTVHVAYPVLCTKDGVYSATPLGILLLAYPSFLISHILGADLLNHHTLWRLSKWTAAWTAGLCLTLFFLVALKIGPPKIAALVTFLVGFASGFSAIVGQGLWSHDGVLTGLLISLVGLFSPLPSLIGLGWGWMFASRLTSATLIAPMGLWLLWKSPRQAAKAGIVGLLAYLPWSLCYLSLYGSPLGPQAVNVSQSQQTVFSLHQIPIGFWGLLFSPGTGFFIYQSWALLLFFYLGRKSLKGRSWIAAFLAMAGCQLLFFSSFYQWSGQFCWGTRYLVETIPLVGLILVPLLADNWKQTRTRQRVAALGILALFIQINGIFLAGGEWQTHPLNANQNMEERSLDWSDPAFLYPLPRLLHH